MKSLNHPASFWEHRFAPNLFYIHAHQFLGACRDMGVFLALLVLRSLLA